ncbi:MAG: isoleucine--tRNA ligase [bacterium]|nr:isoleucine--tRNA ligase [bacterium]
MAIQFSKLEQDILAFWNEKKIFEKTLEKKEKEFVFYDGPPFATGLPHYGHIVASVMKDVVPRYWTMRGYHVDRQWGWDCHGLPIENIIEQELHIKNKRDIEAMGVEKFNDACRTGVLRYVDAWKKFIPKMGRWADMEHSYTTMDRTYTESIWWAWKTLYEKGLAYEGRKSMHICPRCGTPLSNFEVTQGYKDVKDQSVVVKFQLRDEPTTYVLAWTTTPWTLPGNAGLAVKEDVDYVAFHFGHETNAKYIIAKDRLSHVVTTQHTIDETFKGKKLLGKKYVPLFPYYDVPETPNHEHGWQIVSDKGIDFVSLEDGTGIVHMAPAFGEDDMQMGTKHKLPFIQHVDENGRFIDAVKDWAGEDVKPKGNPQQTDKKVIAWLETQGKIFAQSEVTHSYPHCWRCDTPLLNYATSSWFVKVTDIKKKMIANNKKIHWVPEHLQEGRFGKWLEGAKDWAVSRLRYWGAPLPVWKCHTGMNHESPQQSLRVGTGQARIMNQGGCGKIVVVGSVAELEKVSGKKAPEDLHRPHIDAVTWACDCGGTMQRIPDVFDCWFESGSMPYAQLHYPFENKEKFEQNFPAQFIAEGLDQTRGWFYTLLVLSTALFGKPPFTNVIVNGLVLAEDGRKMSKRLKNYPDPEVVIEKYGADAMRLYLLQSPVMRAEDLKFSEKGVAEVHGKVMMILANVLAFYKQYSDTRVPLVSTRGTLVILDRWILAKMHILIQEVTTAMDAYDLVSATRPFTDFVNDLSTWYIRRSRDRLKSKVESQKSKDDAEACLATMQEVLLTLAKVMAPFTPFFAEYLYSELRIMNQESCESVHLEYWPKVEKKLLDEKLIVEMDVVRKIVTLGHAARETAGMKVRQPLLTLRVMNHESRIMNQEFVSLIADELNVKNIEVVKEIKEEEGWVTKKEGGMVVALDTRLNDTLKAEGTVREFIRGVNGLRKQKNLTIHDTVAILYESSDTLATILDANAEAITRGTIASKFERGKVEAGDTIVIGEEEVKIKFLISNSPN